MYNFKSSIFDNYYEKEQGKSAAELTKERITKINAFSATQENLTKEIDLVDAMDNKDAELLPNWNQVMNNLKKYKTETKIGEEFYR